MPLKRGPIYHDITIDTAMITVEHKSDFELKTPHKSPSQASYGVSIVRIWEKIDRVIMAPHCICQNEINTRVQNAVLLSTCFQSQGYIMLRT